MASCWQKVYVNHIHSNSLLEQLSVMWKEEILCDAVVIHDSGLIKVHRVVLRAASHMLQSSDASGVSFLDIKMPSGVGKSSVMEFLTYLYEGILTLSSDNIQDIWKVATYLQVEELEKCCKDFNDNIQKDKNVTLLEDRRLKVLNTESKSCDKFTHFKSTKLTKTKDIVAQSTKRACESSSREVSSAKRSRVQSSESTSHIDSSSGHLSHSMSESFVPPSDVQITVDPDTSTWSQDSGGVSSPTTSSPYPLSVMPAASVASSSTMIDHNPVIVKTENVEDDENAMINEEYLVRKERGRSAVWEFFGFHCDENGRPIDTNHPVCRLCLRRVTTVNSTTSNLLRHLRDHHKDQVDSRVVPEQTVVDTTRMTQQYYDG